MAMLVAMPMALIRGSSFPRAPPQGPRRAIGKGQSRNRSSLKKRTSVRVRRKERGSRKEADERTICQWMAEPGFAGTPPALPGRGAIKVQAGAEARLAVCDETRDVSGTQDDKQKTTISPENE